MKFGLWSVPVSAVGRVGDPRTAASGNSATERKGKRGAMAKGIPPAGQAAYVRASTAVLAMALNSASGMLPRFSLLRRRTETEDVSASLSPTTSM